LGLQHTFTASLMSTEAAGRATSLHAPLTADDIAGISYLYPRGNLAQTSGSIAGRITFPGGQGIHLASVVAIRPTGAAVSAMTDPGSTAYPRVNICSMSIRCRHPPARGRRLGICVRLSARMDCPALPATVLSIRCSTKVLREPGILERPRF